MKPDNKDLELENYVDSTDTIGVLKHVVVDIRRWYLRHSTDTIGVLKRVYCFYRDVFNRILPIQLEYWNVIKNLSESDFSANSTDTIGVLKLKSSYI